MKHFLQFIFVIAILTGCDILFTDNNFIDDKNNEGTLPCKLYHITDDITPFESVFLAEDGNCLAIKKDTTFGYVAVIDSLKADDEKALVVYLDSLGKVRRLFNDGKSLDITHNDERHLNLWYRDTDGTSEVFDLILNTPQDTTILAITKAGEVFDPMDIASIAFALLGLKDIGKAVDLNSHIADGLKANILADLLTVGPFSNTATEVLTGATSVAITAAIGAGGLPLTALLATIGIANAAISDWQNAVADNCFGSAIPITGDAVQVTDKHIVIHYSLSNVVPSKTDFRVGVIVADGHGLFITKNHHLLKESVAYESQSGYITINIEELHKVKGDRLKYRVYLEPINDNGFEWDDELLDYWRYGAVKEFLIDEPNININASQVAEEYDGRNFVFDVEVTMSTPIPSEIVTYGVAIYKSTSDVCDCEDFLFYQDFYEYGNNTVSFDIIIDEIMMHTEKKPYTPIYNYYAVPVCLFNDYQYLLIDNAQKIRLEYNQELPQIEVNQYSVEDNPIVHGNSLIFSIDVNVNVDVNINSTYDFVTDYGCYVDCDGRKSHYSLLDTKFLNNKKIELEIKEFTKLDFTNFVAEKNGVFIGSYIKYKGGHYDYFDKQEIIGLKYTQKPAFTFTKVSGKNFYQQCPGSPQLPPGRVIIFWNFECEIQGLFWISSIDIYSWDGMKECIYRDWYGEEGINSDYICWDYDELCGDVVPTSERYAYALIHLYNGTTMQSTNTIRSKEKAYYGPYID